MTSARVYIPPSMSHSAAGARDVRARVRTAVDSPLGSSSASRVDRLHHQAANVDAVHVVVEVHAEAVGIYVAGVDVQDGKRVVGSLRRFDVSVVARTCQSKRERLSIKL